jgi:hypothetical protein
MWSYLAHLSGYPNNHNFGGAWEVSEAIDRFLRGMLRLFLPVYRLPNASLLQQDNAGASALHFVERNGKNIGEHTDIGGFLAQGRGKIVAAVTTLCASSFMKTHLTELIRSS